MSDDRCSHGFRIDIDTYCDACEMEAQRDESRGERDALAARMAEMEAAQTRHLKLIRDLTQAPLPDAATVEACARAAEQAYESHADLGHDGAETVWAAVARAVLAAAAEVASDHGAQDPRS